MRIQNPVKHLRWGFLTFAQNLKLTLNVHSELGQTFMMELFTEIVND